MWSKYPVDLIHATKLEKIESCDNFNCYKLGITPPGVDRGEALEELSQYHSMKSIYENGLID